METALTMQIVDNEKLVIVGNCESPTHSTPIQTKEGGEYLTLRGWKWKCDVHELGVATDAPKVVGNLVVLGMQTNIFKNALNSALQKAREKSLKADFPELETLVKNSITARRGIRSVLTEKLLPEQSQEQRDADAMVALKAAVEKGNEVLTGAKEVRVTSPEGSVIGDLVTFGFSIDGAKVFINVVKKHHGELKKAAFAEKTRQLAAKQSADYIERCNAKGDEAAKAKAAAEAEVEAFADDVE